MYYCAAQIKNMSQPGYRTKAEHPWSYDPIIQYQVRESQRGDQGLYSDRMWQWDHDKFNKCTQEVWGNQGQYFNDRKPQDIERWISLYLRKPVQLISIEEHCNQATGYPVWFFTYKEKVPGA